MSNQAKETIYLSFGTFANHLTTHFFNEQESYFDYSLTSSEQAHQGQKVSDLIDHDVSFKEGYSEITRAPTYLPRALLFDTQLEFGALRRLNRLYDETYDVADEEDEQGAGMADQLGAQLWGNGNAQVLHTAKSIGKSSYQRKFDAEEMGEDYLDEEEQDIDEDLPALASDSTKAQGESSSKGLASTVASKVWRSHSSKRGYRFWSDYLRVHYHPRSLFTASCNAFGGTAACRSMMGQTAAEAGEEDEGEGDEEDEGIRLEGFDLGYALGKEMEREKDIMDENIRWFAEDCDLLQVISNAALLGPGASLTHAFLRASLSHPTSTTGSPASPTATAKS
jgi:Misato Segment II tubulin-like domain